WIAPQHSPLALMPLLASGLLLSLAVVWYNRLVSRLRRGEQSRLYVGLWTLTALGHGHFGLLLWVYLEAPLDPSALAHDSVLTVMLLYQLLHSGVSVVLCGMQAQRVKLGYVGANLPYEPVVLRPFWLYTLVTFWISFAAFVLLPMSWGGA